MALEGIEGGLSMQQAIAKRINLRLEALNEELAKAKAFDVEVILRKDGFSGSLEGCEHAAIAATIKAKL